VAPEWGPNVKEFKKRFAAETTDGQGPQRLKNLYFTYLVELRALAKATPYLLSVRCTWTGGFYNVTC
jgi:hypothetical protein